MKRMLQLFKSTLYQKIKPQPYKILLKSKMNKSQKQIIFIELIIVGLVIWRYLDDSLTFNSVLTYTLLYITCMFGWFYFQGKQHLYLFQLLVDAMHICNPKLLKLVNYKYHQTNNNPTNLGVILKEYSYLQFFVRNAVLIPVKQTCEHSIHIKISFLQLSGLI